MNVCGGGGVKPCGWDEKKCIHLLFIIIPKWEDYFEFSFLFIKTKRHLEMKKAIRHLLVN